MDKKTHNNYVANLQRSLVEIQERIDFLITDIPDDFDIDEDTDPALIQRMEGVMSIEEEWIIDEEERRKMSVFTLHSEDDND